MTCAPAPDAPVTLRVANGSTAQVLPFGAHLISWIPADGVERLYLSPRALRDGSAPIRGGVPICFPQFNQRVLGASVLPKHGLARIATWRRLAGTPHDAAASDPASAWVEFGWQSDDSVAGLWPHRFAAHYRVELTAHTLTLRFTVANRDRIAWPFALALHTYLNVQDITTTRLEGLEGCAYWDAVAHAGQPSLESPPERMSLRFDGETDRVYHTAGTPLRVMQGADVHTVTLTQSPNLTEVVVWNPGAKLCERLSDMPADGYRHMLCVEAACINQPVWLQPGASWSGWQTLTSAPHVA